MAERLSVAVLVSGRGSNLQALLDAAEAPDYPARIALVLSNRPGVQALARAEAAGVATAVIDHTAYPSRAAFEDDVHMALQEARADLVCLAGFMRVLTPGFLERWAGRVINIHPSLLPAFKGLDPQGQALAAGVKISGCTVHFVVPEVDSGPIIAQSAVPVLEGDASDTLARRILLAEHRLYPRALRLIAEGRVRLDGRFVRIDEISEEVLATT